MFTKNNNSVSSCNSSEKSRGWVKAISLALILSLFIIPQSFADDTTSNINTEYLDELTGDNITWNLATPDESSGGYHIVNISGVDYKYNYNNSKGYETAPDRFYKC